MRCDKQYWVFDLGRLVIFRRVRERGNGFEGNTFESGKRSNGKLLRWTLLQTCSRTKTRVCYLISSIPPHLSTDGEAKLIGHSPQGLETLGVVLMGFSIPS